MSCAAEIPAVGRFCPSCGTPAGSPSQAPTVVSAGDGSLGSGPTSHPRRGSRFVAGELLAGRYRVEGLLGKGGMGEVYRAEDVKLGQVVALKFLPSDLAQKPSMLARFHNEVRLARKVTHPNVCRVHDIEEADGQPFLTMEYVDGENLASLLRRIGRLPPDKAMEIARQLCAGLAAAHDRGVLHRDLKPENVMLDGRGTVRVMDFGLAGLDDELRADDLRSGTPAYMAPEQLEGREVTARSDLYALGLVLYEMFTGRQVFDAPTLDDLRRQRSSFDSADRALPASNDLDPGVERVIRRCLQKEASARPASAVAVAVALAGGDPLAAALAAGELPSPEMVATAGPSAALRPAVAWLCALAAVGLLLIADVVGRPTSLLRHVPFDRPPDALVERARDVVTRIGHEAPVVDAVWGFATDRDPLDWLAANDASPGRWERLASGRFGVVPFWYRQSPRFLEPANLMGRASIDDPPRTGASGDVLVMLDEKGRLEHLEITPIQDESTATGESGPRWDALFEAAGLDPATFAPTPSLWAPPFFADARAAWSGELPDAPGIPVRIEAAAHAGRPVYFTIVFPWTVASRMVPPETTLSQRWAQHLNALLVLAGLFGAMWMARRNALSGRGDRVGAARLGAWAVAMALGEWACITHHQRAIADEFGLFIRGAGLALFLGAFCWVLYMALEPLVRRTWPRTLVSWTRLISGRWRDPAVGRDVLFGLAGAGVVVAVVTAGRAVQSLVLGAPTPTIPRFDALVGFRDLLGSLFASQIGALLSPMLIVLMLAALKALLRRTALAVAATMVLLVPVFSLANSATLSPAVALASSTFVVAVFLTLAARLGLLALVAALVTLQVSSTVPSLPGAGSWFFGTWLLVHVLIGAIAVVACWIALGRAKVGR